MSEQNISPMESQVKELCQKRQYAQALALTNEWYISAVKEFGEEHLEVATALNYIAVLHQTLGKHLEAEPFFKKIPRP